MFTPLPDRSYRAQPHARPALPEQPRCLDDFSTVAGGRIDPATCAHCIIDVQTEFCDPGYGFSAEEARGTLRTRRTAEHIAAIAPLFRDAGMPTFIIYYDRLLARGQGDIDNTLYKLRPAPGDVLIPKDHDSAFRGSDIKAQLQERPIKNLLISGFNLNACVYQTAMDGLRAGYNICILGDCTGNDKSMYRPNTRNRVRELMQRGAVFARAKAVLQRL